MVRKQKGGGSLGSSLRKDKNKAGLKKAEYIRVASSDSRRTKPKTCMQTTRKAR